MSELKTQIHKEFDEKFGEVPRIKFDIDNKIVSLPDWHKIKHFIDQSIDKAIINLAEEKIKELEGELIQPKHLETEFEETDENTLTDADIRNAIKELENNQEKEYRIGYNQAKQEEIDKWKQFISELKQL